MMPIEEFVLGLKAERTEPLCAYLYDLHQLRAHVSRVSETLPPACQLFYAVKANSEAPILRALAPWVRGFEAASLGEIQKIRAIAPKAPVIFGGPGKTDAEIAGAIRHEVRLLHVESLHELQRVEHVADRMGATVPILLRVNLRGPLPTATLQMAGTPTQFGIDEADVPAAIDLARRCRHVELQGFHFHSISNNLDARGHARLIAHYFEKARDWAAQFDFPLRYLNAGGGIGVNYADLRQQFDWEAFTTDLSDVLKDRLPSGCSLLFECGRFLTAACGNYAVEVLDIKRNHGTHFVITRGGTHHFRLPASWQHSHPFTVIPVEDWPYDFPRPQWHDVPITIAGQLCSPKDILARDIRVPRIRMGDIILFHYVGAYGWAISHHDFLSHPHPEHIFLGEAE